MAPRVANGEMTTSIHMDNIPLKDEPHAIVACVTTPTKYDEKLHAPIYPSLWRRIQDRSLVVLAQAAQLCYLSWRWHIFITHKSTLSLSFPFIICETMSK